MSTQPKMYRVRFLVSTSSWSQVKRVFNDDLGITKDKKDDSAVPIRDHYVVEVLLPDAELSDVFYEKLAKSKYITILSDESSQERAEKALAHIAGVELRLRELAIYAYDLAATYKDIMNIKHKDARLLVSNNQLVGEGIKDPVVSFFDFGELIEFLDKTGNRVDEKNLADDTARLIESSDSFDEFKKSYTQKFKKLTVWEIISEAVLVSPTDWLSVRSNLLDLKDIRNTALHHRVLSPAKLDEVKVIASKLMKCFITKTPKLKNVENMDMIFHSWNKALTGHVSYQKAIERMLDVQANSGFQKVISQQLNTEKTFQHALGSMMKIPDIQISAFESLRRSLDSMNKLDLGAWVDENENDSHESILKDEADMYSEQKDDINTEDEKEQEGDKK